jgi:hypothetical protein
MKMKKILTEWRKFIKEGVSNEDIRNQEIEKINNSNLPDKEAQKQIASIYLPMSLAGHIPKGAKEFYEGRILDTDLVQMLDTLDVDVYNHEETGDQTTNSEYFTIETVGQLANETTTEKIRVRSNITEKSQGIFDSIEDLQRRIYQVQKMISEGDFDFGKLSPDFNYGMPVKGGHHRGPDSGDGGVQLPGRMSPAEMAEFEKMMEMFSEAHGEAIASKDLEGEEKYRMLQRVREKQKKFYTYMYELWRDKRGENNSMTSMYKTAAFEDEYDEALQNLLDDSIVVDDRTPEQKEFDEATALVKILEKEVAELGKLAAIRSPKQPQAIKDYQDKQKEARAARSAVQKARMKLRQAARRR